MPAPEPVKVPLIVPSPTTPPLWVNPRSRAAGGRRERAGPLVGGQAEVEGARLGVDRAAVVDEELTTVEDCAVPAVLASVPSFSSVPPPLPFRKLPSNSTS